MTQPRRRSPLAPPEPRRPAAALPTTPAARARLVVRAFGRDLSRAVLVGGVVGIAGSVLIALALPVTIPPVIRWPLIVLNFTAIGMLVAVLSLGRSSGPAYAAFSWLGRREVDQFEKRTGGPVPTTPAALHAWLDAHPFGSGEPLSRIEILAAVGELATARRELGTLPDPATAGDRFEVETMTTWLDWLETGTWDLDRLRRAGAPVTGDDGRRWVEVVIALAESRVRLAANREDWTEPLAAARPRLGAEAGRITLRDTWTRVILTYLLIGAIVAAFAVFVRS